MINKVDTFPLRKLLIGKFELRQLTVVQGGNTLFIDWGEGGRWDDVIDFMKQYKEDNKLTDITIKCKCN